MTDSELKAKMVEEVERVRALMHKIQDVLPPPSPATSGTVVITIGAMWAALQAGLRMTHGPQAAEDAELEAMLVASIVTPGIVNREEVLDAVDARQAQRTTIPFPTPKAKA